MASGDEEKECSGRAARASNPGAFPARRSLSTLGGSTTLAKNVGSLFFQAHRMLTTQPHDKAGGHEEPLATAGLGPSTAAVHAGEARQKPGHAIADPIFASSTYTFSDTQSIVDFIEEKQPREEYGRYGNPGERVVEDKLAAIEGGEEAVLFASGMGALVGLLMAHLNAEIGRAHV